MCDDLARELINVPTAWTGCAWHNDTRELLKEVGK
jgi:hypothetical protein